MEESSAEPPCGDAPDGGGEVVDLGDPVLQQVADAVGALGQQLHRVLRLGVLRQHDHADARVRLRMRSAARTPSSVCVGGMRMSTTTTSGLCG